MKIKITILLLMSCLFYKTSWAQSHPYCGTSLAAFKKIENRLIENKEYLKQHPIATSRSNMTTYIPVKFHLVAKSDGTGRAEYSRVLDQMCLLNEVFQEFDIVFYIKDGFNEVNDSDIYTNNGVGFVRDRMKSYKDNRALNIWVVDEISLGSSSTVIGVWDSGVGEDWVRVVRDRIYFGINGYTLPHEIGHFFSLLHPFYGWEISPYSQELEGQPAPRKAPNFDVLNEYADGTNCEEAGDRICDTPADYLYQIYVNSRTVTTSRGDSIIRDTFNNMVNCDYNRKMTDPKGEILNPDPSLIMGYFLDNCLEHFTPEQVEVMKTDLGRTDRAFLRSNFTPKDPPTAEVQLTSPASNAVVENYNWVPLSWAAVNNATGYVIEISRVPGFGDIPLNYISSSNQITIRNLESDKNYFWRVTAFNDNFTCAAPSNRGRFRTGLSTSVRSIEQIDQWEITPNPTTTDKGLQLTVVASTSFSADLKIYAPTGQLLQQEQGINFGNGKTAHFVDISTLPSGIYLIHLENSNGILNKKFIVSGN